MIRSDIILPNSLRSDIADRLAADQLVSSFQQLYPTDNDASLYHEVAKICFLCAAIEYDHPQLVDLLLESGYKVEVELANNRLYNAPSPLHEAVWLGKADYVQKLLARGASVNFEGYNGQRAISGPNYRRYNAIEFCCMKDQWTTLRFCACCCQDSTRRSKNGRPCIWPVHVGLTDRVSF